jgi:hypothetical protein
VTTRHHADPRPSERIQAVLVIVGLIVLILIARLPAA